MKFFGADKFVAGLVADYVTRGVTGNESCIVIATRTHLNEIDEFLSSSGMKVAALKSEGVYRPFETDQVLDRICPKGTPDRGRLAAFVESEAPAQADTKLVRIYEELGADFLLSGKAADAALLEEMWFEIGNALNFTLYSLYAPGAAKWPVAGDASVDHHAPPRLDEGKLRDVDFLQLQAQQLEAELNELDRRIAIRNNALNEPD